MKIVFEDGDSIETRNTSDIVAKGKRVTSVTIYSDRMVEIIDPRDIIQIFGLKAPL